MKLKKTYKAAQPQSHEVLVSSRIKRHTLFIVLFGLLFLCFVFFRFYKLESRLQFTSDQTENAWVMRTWILEGKVPVKGMEAKATSGFFVGPGYYYLLVPFYKLFNLNPIAAGFFAGFFSSITVIVLGYCISKITNKWVGLLSVFISVFSFHLITFDRIAWPVNILPLVSLGVFYSLWNIIEGKYKYWVLLGISIGFAFHLHLTAIYFVIISFLLLPLLKPWKHGRYVFLGLLCGLVFFIPMIANEIQSGGSNILHGNQYAEQQFHRVYGRRVLQLFPETFIEYSGILNIPNGNSIYPLLAAISTFIIGKKFGWKFAILITVWMFVPTVVLSTYKGELTQYYFVTNRVVTIFLISFLFYSFITIKPKLTIIPGIILLCVFAVTNMERFFYPPPEQLLEYKRQAVKDIEIRRVYDFNQGDPYSYIFEWSIYNKYGRWPKETDWFHFE